MGGIAQPWWTSRCEAGQMAPKSKKKWAALKNTVRVPSMLAREQKKRELKAAEEAAQMKSPGMQADLISAAFPLGHDKPGPRLNTKAAQWVRRNSLKMQDILLNDAIQGCRDWAPVKNPEIVTNVTDSHHIRQGMTAAISDQLNTRLYKGPRREIDIRPVRTPHIQERSTSRSPVPATSSMEVIHSPESTSPSNSPEPLQRPSSAEGGMDIEQLHKHHQLQRQADMRLAAVAEEVNFEADGLVGVASDTAEVAEEVAEVSEEAYNGTSEVAEEDVMARSVSVLSTVEEVTSEHVAEEEADKSIRQVSEAGSPTISGVTPMVVTSEMNVGNFDF